VSFAIKRDRLESISIKLHFADNHTLYSGKDAEKRDLLEFHRRVAIYLEHFARPPQPVCKGRPAAVETELRVVQFDNVKLWIIPQDKQTRCAQSPENYN
jgi:hypothetical protein